MHVAGHQKQGRDAGPWISYVEFSMGLQGTYRTCLSPCKPFADTGAERLLVASQMYAPNTQRFLTDYMNSEKCYLNCIKIQIVNKN